MALLLQFPVAAGVEGDPGGGSLAEPVLMLSPDLLVNGGVPGLAGGFGGVLQCEQRVDGLLRPCLVQAGARLGDRDQLPEQVRVAQGVAGNACVAVAGLPGVVDRDAAERWQDPRGGHTVLAALGVDGDQHELPRRGGMHPGELPGGAEPGLVEAPDVRGDELPGDLLQRGRGQPGGLPRGGGERARRGRAAGQLGKRLAGTIPRQELAVPQVHAGAHDARPVLHRRRHRVRGLRLRFLAAAAQQREQLVPGHGRPDRRDVDDLPALHPGHGRAVQGRPAAPALRRPVPHLLVRVVRELHRRPGLPLRAPWLPPGLAAQRLRRRLRQPVRRRRPRGVPRVRLHPGGQVRDLRLQPGQMLSQHRDLRILLRDPRVPLHQQLPQPRVRSAEPRIAVGTPGVSGTRRTTPRLCPNRK
jgi:hypothetical protein